MSRNLSLFLCWEQLRSSLINFEIYNIILLTIITVRFIRFPGVLYLPIASSCLSFPSLLEPALPNPHLLSRKRHRKLGSADAHPTSGPLAFFRSVPPSASHWVQTPHRHARPSGPHALAAATLLPCHFVVSLSPPVMQPMLFLFLEHPMLVWAFPPPGVLPPH